MSEHTDFPCLDRPANVFRVSVYKPKRGPAVAIATEGRVYNSHSFSGFEYEFFGNDRSFRVPLKGNNTEKNRTVALNALLDMLKEGGMVDESASF